MVHKTPVRGSLFAWSVGISDHHLIWKDSYMCTCAYWQLCSFGQISHDRFSGTVLTLPFFRSEDRESSVYRVLFSADSATTVAALGPWWSKNVAALVHLHNNQKILKK